MSSFKKLWNNWYNKAAQGALDSKDSQSLLFELSKKYDSLTQKEKNELLDILIEWLESDDCKKHFDAFYLIAEYKIVETKEAVRKFCFRFRDSRIPQDPIGYNKWKNALKVLDILENESKKQNR